MLEELHKIRLPRCLGVWKLKSYLREYHMPVIYYELIPVLQGSYIPFWVQITPKWFVCWFSAPTGKVEYLHWNSTRTSSPSSVIKRCSFLNCVFSPWSEPSFIRAESSSQFNIIARFSWLGRVETLCTYTKMIPLDCKAFLLIHSFIQQIFTECLLCSRRCSKTKQSKLSAHMELIFELRPQIK